MGDTYDVRSSEIFEKLEWISIEKTLKKSRSHDDLQSTNGKIIK